MTWPGLAWPHGQQPIQYCSSYVLDQAVLLLPRLDQQSLSQAWIECGNNTVFQCGLREFLSLWWISNERDRQ